MKKNIKYDEAIRSLEEIVNKMENGETDVDSLVVQLKTAKDLIKLCKDKLSKVDAEVKAILGDQE